MSSVSLALYLHGTCQYKCSELELLINIIRSNLARQLKAYQEAQIMLAGGGSDGDRL